MDENFPAKSFKDCPTESQYSHLQTVINNLPYLTMLILGDAILLFAFDNRTTGTITASIYALYGLIGAFWIMVFICPYCRFWGTGDCPCGYGIIATHFTEKKNPQLFSEKFKRHIPVIVPLWFIPVILGGVVMMMDFSFLLLIMLILFAIDSFILLPVLSKKHGCTHCPQKQDCPWMERKT